MAELTKGQLATQNSNSFPNNNAGLITPILLRTFNSDMIDSLVDEISYTADSASVDVSITNLNSTTQSLNTSASLGLTTASFDNGNRNLTFTKGDSTTFSVNIPDVSGSTGNFATTGSNTFVGNQTITGSLLISGSSEFDLSIQGRQLITGPTTGQTPQLLISGSDFNNRIGRGTAIINKAGRAFGSGVSYGRLDAYQDINTIAVMNIGVFDEPNFVTDIELLIQVDTGSGIQFQDFRNDNYAYSTFMSIAPNTGNNPDVIFKRSVDISGSLDIQNTITASLQQGHVLVGDSSGRTTVISTGSFATTGSNTFIGNQIITGSVNVSGSVKQTFNAPTLNNQTDILKVNGATINGVPFAQQTISVQNYDFGGDAYKNAFVLEAFDSLSYNFGGEIVLNGETAQLFVAASGSAAGSTRSGIIGVLDNGNQKVKALLTGQIIEIGGAGTATTPPIVAESITIGRSNITSVISGSLNIQNTITASLQQGHVLVGDSSGRTTTVATSSLQTLLPSGLVSGSSQLTSSYDLRYALSGSGTTINTGSFATTGSNTFNGNQIINGATTSNGNIHLSDDNKIAFGTTPLDVHISSPFNGVVSVDLNIINNSIAGGVTNIDAKNGLNLIAGGTGVSITGNTKISGSNGLSITGSLRVTQTFTASLQEGFVLVGNSSGITQALPTSSIQSNVSGLVTTASFNTYTSSTDVRLTNIESTTASLNTSVASLNTFTASQSTASIVNSITELNTFTQSAAVSITNLNSATASYATTGSNTFVGNQTITGSVIISSSAAVDLTVVGAMRVTGSATGAGISLTSTSLTLVLPNRTFPTEISEGLVSINSSAASELIIGVFDEPNFVNDVELNIRVTSGSGIEFKDWDNGDAGYETFMSIAPNVSSNPDVVFKRSVDISGSLDIQNTITASLQQGHVLVGNAAGRTTTVATSSFATNISNLATTGSNSFNGSQSFTGSVAGNVVSASITSNTASIDFSLGNYFEITSSVTPLHLNVTNITAGRTSTLIISASASSSILFSPNVAQPSGSAYSGSLGSIDILSLVAFNSSKVNLVATKALV